MAKTSNCLVFVSTLALSIQQGQAQLKDDIGFTALQDKLGVFMPTGSGISVTQAEAQEGGNYRPDPNAFLTKNFVFASGGSTSPSGHATSVGQFFYGTDSLAPGIGVLPERITSYDAGGFLTTDFLRTGNPGALPQVETNDIQNHSWIGNFTSTDLNVEALRRIDYAIQRDDFVAAFGVNNFSNNPVPILMAGAYNGITVGNSNGDHSRGGIAFDGGLRTRPDIVVPTTLTSLSTPTVGSAAALLLETARGTPGLTDASRSVVVKSLLFTGATRDEPEFGGNWAHSQSQPLDAVYGAGELNILHSHDILVEGQHNASNSTSVADTGWDLGASDATVPQLYFFDLDSPGHFFEIAASLVWNRDIAVTDTNPDPDVVSYEFTPSLANLNLRLFSASGFTLGSEIEASLSEVDNVELVLAKGLAPGRYAWEVSSNTDGVDYGFSWNVEGLTLIPEPSTLTMTFLGLLILVRRRR